MKILKTAKGVVLEVQVKPRARSFMMQANDELVVFCTRSPLQGKVNQELTKELQKVFGRKVEVASGFHSKTKRILIENIDEEKVLKILESVKKREAS